MQKITLLDHFGGDNNHVNVARVSFGKEAENYTEDQNNRLLNYLVKHGHSSPFRHSTLQFRIKCSIYSERQIFKHQIGVSVNSISGRYVDFSDSYYEIKQFRTQSKDSKQGSGEDLDEKNNRLARIIQMQTIRGAKRSYQKLLNLGVSKEQARSVLPLSLETEFIWTGSFLAFTHLCNLRLKPDTQKETRDIVEVMLKQVKEIPNEPFKHSLKAFGL